MQGFIRLIQAIEVVHRFSVLFRKSHENIAVLRNGHERAAARVSACNVRTLHVDFRDGDRVVIVNGDGQGILLRTHLEATAFLFVDAVALWSNKSDLYGRASLEDILI